MAGINPAMMDHWQMERRFRARALFSKPRKNPRRGHHGQRRGFITLRTQ
jgi:hypothetical protein